MDHEDPLLDAYMQFCDDLYRLDYVSASATWICTMVEKHRGILSSLADMRPDVILLLLKGWSADSIEVLLYYAKTVMFKKLEASLMAHQKLKLNQKKNCWS